LGIERQVYLLGYRDDVHEICKISDIFAFPSFRVGEELHYNENYRDKCISLEFF
jgi:hypothetical protein